MDKIEEEIQDRKDLKANTVIKFNKKSIIVLIIAIFLIYILLENFYIDKEYEEVESCLEIQPPTQIEAEGDIYKIVNGANVNIKILYEYIIKGRVVGTQNYLKYNLENSLSPKDVGITWGFLANEEYDDEISWTSASNRFLYWKTKDSIWLNSVGGANTITAFNSNNHLIPSDENIEKLISAIKVGDFVKIEGYLVKISAKLDDYYYTWNSSTSRYDTGDGACEVIYVTDVKWLKEK